VKELCLAAQFGLEHLDRSSEEITMLNFSLDPPPTMETYVDAIREVTGKRRAPLQAPRFLLLAASYPIAAVAKLFGIRQPIDPVRLRKTFRSTYIDPRRLRELGYSWKYSIEDAFRDWMQDRPEDFLP